MIAYSTHQHFLKTTICLVVILLSLSRATASSFEPITDLTVVYETEPCPENYMVLSTDLNEGTNGKSVHLCYARGGAQLPIREIVFRWNIVAGWLPANCPSGYTAVLHKDTADFANLNEGATGQFLWWQTQLWITMCYRRGENECNDEGECQAIYQLRTLNGLHLRPPRWFQNIPVDLNAGVVGNVLSLAYSRSPTFGAALVAAADGINPRHTAAWSHATELYSESDSEGDMDIEVTLHIDCQKDGGRDLPVCYGNTPLEDDEFERLCGLVRQSIETYWSGPVTTQGSTRNVIVTTVEGEDDAIIPNKDIDICQCGQDYGDGTTCHGPFGWTDATHHNSDMPFLDMTLWYNKGRVASKQIADDLLYRIASHEFGHSALFDYGGLLYSYNHKGTSDFFTGSLTDSALQCPENGGVLDMMKAYTDTCWFDVESGAYSVAVDPWDRAGMLMTAGDYEYIKIAV